MTDNRKFKIVRNLWIAIYFLLLPLALIFSPIFLGLFVYFIAPICSLIVLLIQIALGYRSIFEIIMFISIIVQFFIPGGTVVALILRGFMPLWCFALFLLERRRVNSFGYKRYYSREFRGFAQEPISFVNSEVSGIDFYNKIKEVLTLELQEKSIPAKIYDAEIISGNFMTGTVLPMLIIKNPNHKFFDLGMAVNDKTVIFPLLGESAENTKANMNKYYNDSGKYFKAAFTNADEFKLQEEVVWRQSVIDCFNALCE